MKSGFYGNLKDEIAQKVYQQLVNESSCDDWNIFCVGDKFYVKLRGERFETGQFIGLRSDGVERLAFNAYELTIGVDFWDSETMAYDAEETPEWYNEDYTFQPHEDFPETLE